MSEIELILTKLKIVSEEKENGMYLCDKEHSKILLDYIQQKENIIKEVRGDLDKQIDFCTNEANGTTNDKYCRIAIQYLKHLKQKLDKENRL